MNVSRTNTIHESLAAFLNVEHGSAHLDEVLAALTFETGRLIGIAMKSAPPAEVDIQLARIAVALREHVAAFRRTGKS
jgi:hypothetical protein